MTNYQLKQKETIDKIEREIVCSSLTFSTVSPVEDYKNDNRIALTSVHLPHKGLIDQVRHQIIKPLQETEPDYYYYEPDSLHMTIKNIRVINNPVHFTQEDIQKAKEVFTEIVPESRRFSVYFYRLLLFPNNLALVGTTDPELDSLVRALDTGLKKAGVPDDKIYVNDKYFFSNMTLARFNRATERFKKKIEELSHAIAFKPYVVDSVTLLTCNAVCKKKRIISSWELFT